MTDRLNLAEIAVTLPAVLTLLLWVLPGTWLRTVARVGAVATCVVTLAAAGGALLDPGSPREGDWLVLDAAGALLLGVTALVGLVSVLASPAYLDTSGSTLMHESRRARTYFTVLYAFWAILLAIPLAANLVEAWLLVEASTAVSAFLVGFSGKPRALEASWKYLVLTSLGLGVALLGMVLLAGGIPGGGLEALSWSALPRYAGGASAGLVAYLLVLAGLAAKIGWAPVHNWLPDAHSEAPAPVSALLSAALLPTVLLVAWRCEQGLEPVLSPATAHAVLIGFGLVSVAVAVPFLARPMAWKRLLAYSSLEHMGVLALGIGFATPLALAGVAVHLVGHAIAKTLGFVTFTPLSAHDPRAAVEPVTGAGRARPALGTAMGLSLAVLSGLPPSPLFVSELMIVAGGFQAGRAWAAATAALLLALVFVGLLRVLVEMAAPPPTTAPTRLPGLRGVGVLAAVSAVALLALAAASPWLPATDLVQALMKGAS